jgi:hypothetical protein
MKYRSISVLIIVSLLTASLFVFCNAKGDHGNSDADHSSIDTLDVFSNITAFDITDSLQITDAKIISSSVSRYEFFNALHRNYRNVRFFSRTYKINEALEPSYAFRDSGLLLVRLEKSYKCFYDTKASEFSAFSSFFLENKIKDFYVIKCVDFEDASTNFINSKTGVIEFSLDGLLSFTDVSTSVILYSKPLLQNGNTLSSLTLLRVEENKIDTLICSKMDWYVRFAFFDMESKYWYYIHSIYSDYEGKFTFAKTIVKLKE